jgi:hypothetical protein
MLSSPIVSPAGEPLRHRRPRGLGRRRPARLLGRSIVTDPSGERRRVCGEDLLQEFAAAPQFLYILEKLFMFLLAHDRVSFQEPKYASIHISSV